VETTVGSASSGIAQCVTSPAGTDPWSPQ
jgi:hypothetical protein